MLLPTSYPAVLILLVLSMLCWGLWVSTQKLTGKWRFELFYYDFAFGTLLSAVVAAFTLGSLNSRELTFQDNFLIAAYHNMAYAAGAGIIFNLGNLLFVGAISVSGMAVAFPLSWGVAMVVGGIWGYLVNPHGSAVMLAAGALLVLLAVIVQGAAYSVHVAAQRAVTKTLQPDSRQRTSRPPSAAKGIVLGLISGVFIGSAYALVDVGRAGENGVGPYGLALLFAAGHFFSTLFLNPFFLSFPVQGKAMEVKAYFKGTKRQHLLGILGGSVWIAGALANFTALYAPPGAQASPLVTNLLLQGAALVGLVWGLLAWREFQGTPERVKVLMAGMLILYLAGAGLMAVAPIYAK